LDLSSFQLNEHNKMTLNKVPYNEHRAQGPCHCGPKGQMSYCHHWGSVVRPSVR
jgi:hypothetical protein